MDPSRRRFYKILTAVGLAPALSLSLMVSVIAAQQPALAPAAAPPADQVTLAAANPPNLKSRVEADYPNKARFAKLTGRCAISALVDTSGIPQNLTTIRCTDPIFEKPSLEAAARYRFDPATTADGKPIAVTVAIEVNYRLIGGQGSTIRITYSRYTPPGVTSFEPDSHGIYPYAKTLDPPTLVAFADEGYGDAAFAQKGTSACDLILTIDKKGKAGNAEDVHCVRSGLELAIIHSILDSRFEPGKMNGKSVAVRMAMHIEFVGFYPQP